MIRAFQILAAVLIAAAAFFLFRLDYDDAFVTGVLGICSFFLSIRFTFKSRVPERLATEDQEADDATDEPTEPESEQQ
jgi:cadmium resistance protein CadD (predicted permease)